MSYIKVEDDKSLVRDSNSSAILNTNKKALDEYKRTRQSKLSMQNKIDNLEKELQETKENINKILQLLENKND